MNQIINNNFNRHDTICHHSPSEMSTYPVANSNSNLRVLILGHKLLFIVYIKY